MSGRETLEAAGARPKPPDKTGILVIGHGADRSPISPVLERYGYVVEESGPDRDALERAYLSSPDLVILDTADDGGELIQLVRGGAGDASRPPAPVLVIVAPGQVVREAAEFEFIDIISKPADELELLSRVRTLVALKRVSDELLSLKGRVEGKVAERTEVLERALRGQGYMLSEAQEARRVWEATFNSMADAIAITDTSGQITLANKAASEFFYATKEEMLGWRCDRLLAGGAACPHGASVERGGVIEHETLSRAGDRLLNLRVTSFRDANGSALGFVHVFRDVTRERALERHLMQVERMSLAGMMVSAVAHEVATPLSVIANIAEVLLMDVSPGTTTAVELNKIVNQSRRVAEMMRSMLNFVRQKPAQFTTVSLADLARETVDLMGYELRKSGIEVSIRESSGTPQVWGDRAQLQQVLLNLITNAMQAMVRDGHLRILIAEDPETGERGRSSLMIVEDSGPGIAPEAMDRLFDFFFTTRLATGGTGLGLAITRQIVEGHGGTIKAENMSGGGARFTVRLPAAIRDGEGRSRRTTALARKPADS